MPKHLLTFADHSPGQAKHLLQLACQIKAAPATYAQQLAGKSVVALFEKPSLRTRVSLEVGIYQLGGQLVYLDSQQQKLGGRESLADMAANLGCWAHAIIARVDSHHSLQQLSAASPVPVVNALCDLYHPCQALADFITLQEAFGTVEQVKLAYVGDGNNVAHSLMLLGALLGSEVVVITPSGFEPNPAITSKAQQLAKQNGAKVTVSNDLQTASGAQVVYTDTWQSMGDTTPLAELGKHFAGFQVNQAMMDTLGASKVMHCQPAHRDLEISSELMDSSASLLLQQATNRLYAQNAILTHLLSE